MLAGRVCRVGKGDGKDDVKIFGSGTILARARLVVSGNEV